VTTDGDRVSTTYRNVPPGKLPPVGNTVDVKNATYTNSIGDTQLSATWTDPDFDPSETRFTTCASSAYPQLDLHLDKKVVNGVVSDKS